MGATVGCGYAPLRRGVVKKLIARFVSDERGQDLIEYGLLIGIITVGAIAAVISIGPKVTKYFTDLDGKLK